MKKLNNGVYESSGKFHLDYYKMIGSCVYRLSTFHKKWILCLDEAVINIIKKLEKQNEV